MKECDSVTSQQIFSLQRPQQIFKMATMPVSENTSPRCLGTATIRKQRDTIAKCSRLHISKALPAHKKSSQLLHSFFSHPIASLFFTEERSIMTDKSEREDAYSSNLSFSLFFFFFSKAVRCTNPTETFCMHSNIYSRFSMLLRKWCGINRQLAQTGIVWHYFNAHRKRFG